MYKRPREIPGPIIPKEIMRTTTEDLSIAGRNEESFERLKNAALGMKELGNEVTAMILPKLKPYAPGPGLDNMIFVVKKNGKISSIDDLSTRQLLETLNIATEIEEVYRAQEDHDNQIEREVVAINYHKEPLDERVFGKKLHAQTLEDLHVHVLAFRRDDLRNLRKIDQQELSKQEYDDVDEPFSFVIDTLIELNGIKKKINNGLTLLRPKYDELYQGLNFAVDSSLTESEEFASDLKTLHKNIEILYQEVSDIFSDSTKRDETGMPTLRSRLEQTKRIEEFVARISNYDNLDDDTKKIERLLKRLSRIVLSGEQAKNRILKKAVGSADEIRIFLRNFAYTLSIIKDKGEDEVLVNFTPRIVSTGNLLASLGLHKKASEKASHEWLNERSSIEEALRKKFSEKESEQDKQAA